MQNNGGESMKRKIDCDHQGNDENPSNKRRSRFADDEGKATSATAKAAEMSRNTLQKKPNGNGNESSQFIHNQEAAISLARAAEIQAQVTAKIAAVAKAAEMQKSLAAQIASVSSLLSNVQQNKAIVTDRKPAYRALKLDANGREIDEYGQVVKTTIAKTIAINVAVEREKTKKDNPYLAHTRIPIKPISQYGPPGMASVLPSNVPGALIPVEEVESMGPPIDERIVASNRSIRAKKSLKFAEAGINSYIAVE